VHKKTDAFIHTQQTRFKAFVRYNFFVSPFFVSPFFVCVCVCVYVYVWLTQLYKKTVLYFLFIKNNSVVNSRSLSAIISLCYFTLGTSINSFVRSHALVCDTMHMWKRMWKKGVGSSSLFAQRARVRVCLFASLSRACFLCVCDVMLVGFFLIDNLFLGSSCIIRWCESLLSFV